MCAFDSSIYRLESARWDYDAIQDKIICCCLLPYVQRIHHTSRNDMDFFSLMLSWAVLSTSERIFILGTFSFIIHSTVVGWTWSFFSFLFLQTRYREKSRQEEGSYESTMKTMLTRIILKIYVPTFILILKQPTNIQRICVWVRPHTRRRVWRVLLMIRKIICQIESE